MEASTRPYLYSQRIIGAELPREGKPILISNYTISDRGDKDYVIDLSAAEKPFVQVNQTLGAELSPDLARALGVENDTYVCSGSNPKYWEGLRTVHFYVKDYEKPVLDLAREPWSRFYYWKYLFGSVDESRGCLKIPGCRCYVDPHLWMSDKSWFENVLSTQGSDSQILSAPDIKATVTFAYLKNLDKEWLESEFNRFRDSGEGLTRDQIVEKFKHLKAELDLSVIRSREILAWPIASVQDSELPSDSVTK